MSLMNHCGADRITLDKLRLLDDPVPYTPTHCPIRHDVFVDLARDCLTSGGYEIAAEEYSLKQQGRVPGASDEIDNMFGLITLANGNADTGRVVGLRNSGSMHFLAQLGCGGHVFVCDNLVFSAQIIVGRKHTRHILRDLPDQMASAIHVLGREFDRQAVRQDIYQNWEISDETAHDLMIRTMALPSPQGIPGSKMGKWLNEYREPKHEAFKTGTAWGLQNAFTETAKTWSFGTMQNRTEGLIKVMDDTCGFEDRYASLEAAQ